MASRLEIVDLPQSGQVQLAWRSAAGHETAPPVAFVDPLGEAEHQELAWYFQEYLDNPFGAAKARAASVEQDLRSLGVKLFQEVFQGSPESQSLYAQATAQGLEEHRLVIASRRLQFLSLPWELLFDPDLGFLAPRLAGVVRQSAPDPLPKFRGQPFNQPSGPLSSQQLNVLLVSPMPSANGESPADTASLAEETVQILESLPIQVELDYLRPPTLEALAHKLSQHPSHYHLVHLDGISLANGAGHLLLESPGFQGEPAPARRVAELLTAAGVPVVLVGAGSSGPENAPLGWAAVSSTLAEGGLPAVVSLPCALQGPAREKFLRAFYLALVRGAELPVCVAAARRALLEDPHRPTPAGKAAFWDWILPSVCQSQEYTPPVIEEETPNPLTPPGGAAPHEPAGPQVQLPAAGPLGLVGRRGELRQLERLLEQVPVVRLTGDTGIGKTTLALGLARWLQKSGAMSGGVFYTTFDWGAGVERVVHEIGTAVAGLAFADLSGEARRRWVVDYLQEQPSLLIWDGVESVAGFPAGAPGVLELAEQTDLNAFLAEVTQGGVTRALLVSRRRNESWRPAGSDSVLALAGLKGRDRIELGQKVLERAEVDPARLTPEYLQALDLLEGNPLAMQIALPLLKQVPPSVLTGELKAGMANLQPSAQEESRAPCLTTAMECAWGHLSHRSRTHLPFLSLFQRRVMLDIVTHITTERVYRTAMREELGWGACRTLLRTALVGGFLEPVSPSVFQIHPAMPWFFGRKLHQQASGTAVRQLEQEFLRVYADTADYFMETLYENQDAGATAVLAEEGNLTQALGLALEARQWEQAQLLVQPLAQVYRMQKRYPELRRLRRQLLDVAGQTAAEATSRGAGELWLYLLGTEASEAVDLLELDYGESLNQQLLEHLLAQPEGATDPRTAAVHHQLGVIALRRGQVDAAEGCFQQSLGIIEGGEDPASAADDYYSLGQVKQYQRRYTEAKEWFKKALDLHQRIPDQEEMVKDYRALGLMCQMKFEYDEAHSWYTRAREMVEESRDEETALMVFHDLGTLCHAQYLFDDAESWYMQALSLGDRLGNEPRMAVEMHHLGLLAQARGILYDDAEGWYVAALEKHQKLGNRRGEADECRQLGVLFHEQKRLPEAEEWYQRAREVFESLKDVQRSARTYGQLAMIAEERGDLPHALEWAARTYRLASEYSSQGIGGDLLLQVKSHLARLRDKYGQENFQEWWRGSVGANPPTDLDVDTSGIL
ncbi:MAG: tetratricopeptide repeat protein [Dehalococcoidia bacterium]|nr:tetratricopeptide repeat protein [Dehalococcoidia bacterium]